MPWRNAPMPVPDGTLQTEQHVLLTHGSQAMSTLERIATCGAIVGFLFVSSGCVVAPDSGYYGHDRYVREHRYRYHDDRDHRYRGEWRCEDRDHDGDCDRHR